VRSGPPILAVRDLRRQYSPTWSLVIPALDVHVGEVLAVIGPNGSGKSTLLRILGLLETPDEGEIRYHGEPLGAADGLAVRRRMAMVFQQPLLVAGTVSHNVGLGLAFRGVPAAARVARVERWLERFGIAALAQRQAPTLSGGQAQRVALARALVLEPEVLLLDEPFGGLDEPTRAALLPDLWAILDTERVTTVLVTHDRGEARALADRVAVLMDGRLQQVDETAQVFQAPASEDVARFVGVETIMSGEVVSTQGGMALVEVRGRTLEIAAPARRGDRVRLGIRPEDVTLVEPSADMGRSRARNQLAGTVVRLTPGNPVRVLVDVGFPLVAAVSARSVEEMGLRPGAAVTAVFKASVVHVIHTLAS
jgi:tungstate transport system ATP-binding protein